MAVGFSNGNPTVTRRGRERGMLLMRVTVDDIGLLDDETFIEVWRALGIVARRRGRRRVSQLPPAEAGDLSLARPRPLAH